MKHRKRAALAGLLSAAALAVAACGNAGGDAGDTGHGNAHGKEPGAAENAETAGAAGMDHQEMGHGSGAPGMLTENGRYSDERFIDAMVPHHRGAVEMAEVAPKNAEHQRVRDLAQNIVASQEAEIKELEDIKREEFGTSEVPTEMSVGQKDSMGMTNPADLADQKPFDRAFIDAMIPHHESAIEMAQVAREKSDNPRVRELAGEIVGAQEREISRMRSWRAEWYPEG